MTITFAGISAVRARLARLAEGLREAASGEVLARAAAAVQAQVDAVAKDKLGRHEATGAALGSLTVTASGGLVQLTANRYLSFHGWWPFRRGMPPFVVKRAAVILARELLAAIGGKGGALADEAGVVVEEADAADHAKKEKARGKADAAAERKSLRLARATDKRIAKREGGHT